MAINFRVFQLFIMIFTISCTTLSPVSQNYYRVANKANQEISTIIPINVTSLGAMIPYKIHAYCSIFHLNASMTLDSSRQYALLIARTIKNCFNKDIAIHEFLETSPFSFANIHFDLYAEKTNNVDSIDYLSFSEGVIKYYRLDRKTNTTTLLKEEFISE